MYTLQTYSKILGLLVAFGVLLAVDLPSTEPPLPPLTLSEYGFFQGQLADLEPAERVIPYELNAPLFSDYASKSRFIYLPPGTTMQYDAQEVFDFPVGTTLIKTFYYPVDARRPEKGRRLLETRLLIRETDSWVALPYIWNEAQTEANLEVTGGTQEIQWRDENGKKHKLDYYVPNMVECKSCHARDNVMTPIGPTARQLHRPGADGTPQLVSWYDQGWLTDLPDPATIATLADWENPAKPLHARARAYLDSNCGHCHRPEGPANTSGMFLNIATEDPGLWGVNKPPVAAGRGAGGKSYGIVPGQPDASILVHRMEATDPGVMMPEIGRQLVHEEGVALIREWIGQLEE